MPDFTQQLAAARSTNESFIYYGRERYVGLGIQNYQPNQSADLAADKTDLEN